MKKIRKYLDKFFEHMRQLLQTNKRLLCGKEGNGLIALFSYTFSKGGCNSNLITQSWWSYE